MNVLSLMHTYAIPEKALRRWDRERLRQEPRAGGGIVYFFVVSGSTCSNMGLPLEALMTVSVDADGRIESATSHPAPADRGCSAMCAAESNACRFFAEFGSCDKVIGRTLHDAAFRNWQEEPSGCLCTTGNRRHKWRNLFQTLHYAATQGIVGGEKASFPNRGLHLLLLALQRRKAGN
jgi:hypothetical protein